MAEVIPFRGILYDPDRIKELAEVVTPPYDVISPEEQKDYHKRHPNNIIRLILGKKTENDTPLDNYHTRAAAYFENWLSEGILVRDESPAFYVTTTEFPFDEKLKTRFGLIALVGLEPFEKGIVLPHEKTFSKVKSERLQLMTACHANFSPIFSLYPGQSHVLDTLKTAVSGQTPDMDFVDGTGQKHRLWRVTDPAQHRHVADAMQQTTLFIADGHHRYETALNYRDWIAAKTPDFNADHPANYVLMYLCSMEDPGLIIRPAHRLLREVGDAALDALIPKSSDYFDITTFPFGGEDAATASANFIASLESNGSKTVFGVFLKDRSVFHQLTLKPGVMEAKFGDELPESLRNLDVTVLTRLVFMEILGFSQSRLDNEKLISYSSSEEDAIEAVRTGQYDVTFLLNPTRIEEVRRIAEAGLIMPRKSTYFYPKVITGQVLNSLKPAN